MATLSLAQGPIRDADGLERLQANLYPRPDLFREDDHRQDVVGQAWKAVGTSLLFLFKLYHIGATTLEGRTLSIMALGIMNISIMTLRTCQ